MTSVSRTSPSPLESGIHDSAALALRLANAENALHALATGQIDAIIDSEGRAHLLRPVEEHVWQHERRLQGVIDSTPDVITVVNRGGVILSQSQAGRRVLECEPEELIGKKIFENIHVDDFATVHSAFTNVIEEIMDHAAIQFRHRTGNGSYLNIHATVAKLRDVSPARAVFSLRSVIHPVSPPVEPDTPENSAPLELLSKNRLAMLTHELRTAREARAMAPPDTAPATRLLSPNPIETAAPMSPTPKLSLPVPPLKPEDLSPTITERKQAEEALLQAGALQSAIFNSANFSSIATDARGVIQIFNVGAERMLGYTAAEVMNKITPADISDPQELISRAKELSTELGTPITPGFEALVFKASRGIEDIYELTYIRKDGSRFPAIVSVTALRDAHGEIIGYLLIGTDNTARKQVEADQQQLDQRLRDQQFYTRSLIESNIDALMTTDPSGIITDVNKQTEALTGCTRDELIGAPFKNYFTDPDRARAGIKLVLSEKKLTNYELTARARDGRETVVSCNATTFYDRDRKLQGVFAAARDVTERKQVERELSEKARLLDLSNDAIIVHDLDDKISSWNKGAEELYGWTSAEVIGKHLDALLRMEFPKPMEEILAQLQSEGQFSGEVVQIARDGRRMRSLCRWVLDRGTKSILTSYTDITERRMLEDSLAARASDLVQADRSKDEFLAMLAHELRNPLAPLRNAAAILRTEDASSDECGQAQRIIGRQIENMTRMIDDLLDVSRITEGKIELRRKPVSLADTIFAAVSVARSGITARHQHLAISLPAEPIFLYADATRLDQVFGNLLGNACKYSDPGCHIWLSAEAGSVADAPSEPGHPDRPTPDADERRDGSPARREVVVRVRDDGMGITPELLPHIFDLFVQATRSLDRAHGGLGIGLTLVHRLVKMHGGSVEARSGGLGRGSEFIVRLPIFSGPVAAAPPPPVQPTREAGRRMLIVDDNEDATSSMAMLQRRRGHETRTASTGPDAVAVAAEFAPEVVLLDIGLPGMDGFEVARRLRTMPALAGAFLVAMSGYGSDEDRATAKEAGFDEYLIKPVDLDLLRTWLASRD